MILEGISRPPITGIFCLLLVSTPALACRCKCTSGTLRALALLDQRCVVKIAPCHTTAFQKSQRDNRHAGKPLPIDSAASIISSCSVSLRSSRGPTDCSRVPCSLTSATKVYGLRQWFIHSAESLAQKGYKINLQKKFLSKGWLIRELLTPRNLL